MSENPSTEQVSNLARLHSLWLQHLQDLVAAGVRWPDAVETMFGVAVTAKMNVEGIKETVTLLRDLAQRLDDDAEEMQRNAAAAKAERVRH